MGIEYLISPQNYLGFKKKCSKCTGKASNHTDKDIGSPSPLQGTFLNTYNFDISRGRFA
jgi:hypothetical protein